MLYELEHGPISALEARNRRMEGGYIPVALYLDAKSVFAAISATFIKQPAEKSLLCHVQYLRELLDKHVLQYLFWLDTRDMGADGLTKGAVTRSLLHSYMDGYMTLQHEHSQWSSKVATQRVGWVMSGSRPTEAHPTPRHLHLGSACSMRQAHASASFAQTCSLPYLAVPALAPRHA